MDEYTAHQFVDTSVLGGGDCRLSHNSQGNWRKDCFCYHNSTSVDFVTKTFEKEQFTITHDASVRMSLKKREKTRIQRKFSLCRRQKRPLSFGNVETECMSRNILDQMTEILMTNSRLLSKSGLTANSKSNDAHGNNTAVLVTINRANFYVCSMVTWTLENTIFRT